MATAYDRFRSSFEPFWPFARNPRPTAAAARDGTAKRNPKPALALLCALGFGVAAHAQSPQPVVEAGATPPSSILLVTFDTTRADRIGAYGYAAAKTPTLDRLAREGVLFETALTTNPVTLPSHTSILTGLYPTAHGVRDNGAFALPPEARLISEALRDLGWRTGAFTGAYVLDSKFGLAQGFEVYRDADRADAGTDSFGERRADDVTSDAIAWFKTVDPGERFFAWVHYYDPHAIYDPPEPWRSANPDPYDGEIAFSDSQLDRLLRQLERLGLARNLLVAMTSDHGESLGEHGELIHGILAYDSTLRVPLIVSGPAVAAAAGTRVTRPVSIAALAPTLLTLSGVDRSSMPGVPFASLLSAGGRPIESPGPIYSESLAPYYTARWHALRSLREGSMTLIEGKTTELYDVAADPAQLENLASQQPERVARMRETLAELVAAHPSRGWNALQHASTQDQRLLATLGYAVGTVDSGDPFDASLPDPITNIDEFVQISLAYDLIEKAQQKAKQPVATAWQRDELGGEVEAMYLRADEILAKVLAESPENVMAMSARGVVQKRLGRHERAVELLERFLVERPFETLYRYRLATSYYALGRHADAARQIRRVLDEDPEFAAASHWMIEYHVVRNEFGRALWWAEQAQRSAREGSTQQREFAAGVAQIRAEMEAHGQKIQAPD